MNKPKSYPCRADLDGATKGYQCLLRRSNPHYGLTEDLDRIPQHFMVSSKVTNFASESSRRGGEKITILEGMQGR